jgi:hypothetical protein
VVLTPLVPSQSTSAADPNPPRTERFLYAIDETNQSVLAVDYSDPLRASFGAVLTVGASLPSDRLAVPFPARAIEVLEPAWPEPTATDPDPPLPGCGEEPSSTSLRGVFLAVATTDGRVRIFDVFDLDAGCRASCNLADTDSFVAVGRHRPRIIGFDQDAIAVDPAPSWSVSGATLQVDEDTGVADEDVSTLESVTCPGGLEGVFGGLAEEARICGIVDPWAATSQRYNASWEGALPNTTMTGASLDPDEPAIDVRFDPCALGVLGSANVPGAGPLGNYAGDAVAITSPLAPARADDELCERITQENDAGETTPILFPLLSASTEAALPTYGGRLVIGESALNVRGATLGDVRTCFPELLEIEVRARSAFVVASTRAGFRHPVVAGADGTCEVDPAAVAAGDNGRALPGQLFQTPEVAFQPAGVPVEGAILTFVTANIPQTLAYDISFDAQSGTTDLPSLLAGLEFNEIDDRLYVVDQARRGLVRVNVVDGGAIESVFR